MIGVLGTKNSGLSPFLGAVGGASENHVTVSHVIFREASSTPF